MISTKVNQIEYYIRNPKDTIQHTLLNGHQWNVAIYFKILQYIQQYNLNHFVNVGCHIGTIALPVSLYINKVTVFEAFPKTFDHLCANIRLNKRSNVWAYNVALGNEENGTVYFMKPDQICSVENINRTENNSGGMHVFTEKDISNNTRSVHLCDNSFAHKMTTLDSMATQIGAFDILLVDIEGFEYEFLQGAQQTLLNNRAILIIEIWNNEKRQKENMQTTQEEIIQYIETQFGYKKMEQSEDDFIFMKV